MTKVKLSTGKEVEVRPIKWKEAKNIGLTGILQKIGGGEITDEDLDRIISVFVPNEKERDELEYNDIMEVFTAFVELAEEKKQ